MPHFTKAACELLAGNNDLRISFPYLLPNPRSISRFKFRNWIAPPLVPLHVKANSGLESITSDLMWEVSEISEEQVKMRSTYLAANANPPLATLQWSLVYSLMHSKTPQTALG